MARYGKRHKSGVRVVSPVNPCPGLKAPLHPLPVMVQPWQQIAVDIVGELNHTKRGNRFILTVMDFASRWPALWLMQVWMTRIS